MIETNKSPNVDRKVMQEDGRASQEGRQTPHAEISQGITLFNSQKISMRSSNACLSGDKQVNDASLTQILEENKSSGVK